MSLSADGLTVAIGASHNDGNGNLSGHVRVYQYDSNKDTADNDQNSPTYGPVGWNRLGQDIDGEAAGDYSGYSVSLSSDGSIVAIGAFANDGTTGTSNDNRGHVRVYQYDSNKDTADNDQNSPTYGPVGWNRLGQDIDGEAADDQSQVVSLSADGLTVAIGATNNNRNGNNSGHVRVYQYDSTKTTAVTNQDSPTFGPVGWNRLGQDINGESSLTYLGESVALSADGSTVAIGSYGSSSVKTYKINTAIPIEMDALNVTSINSLTVGRGGGNSYTNGAVGIGALYSNTTGSENTATGSEALYSNTTGNNNTATGFQALRATTTGSNNTAVGNRALKNNTDIHNSAFGYDALNANTTGDNNTASGYQALVYNSSGQRNTATGSFAGAYNYTGSYNTYVGYNAGVAPGGQYTNSTALGAGARITSNNQIMLGTTTENVYIPGYLFAAGGSNISDYRIKENVIPISDTSYNIDNLRPVTYTNTIHNKQDIGLIAHEVQEEFPLLVTGEKDGKHNQAVNYIGLIGVLIHEIQQLKKRVNELEQSNP